MARPQAERIAQATNKTSQQDREAAFRYLAAMIDAGMVAKMICSFPRSSDPRAFTEKYLAGEIELVRSKAGELADTSKTAAGKIDAAMSRIRAVLHSNVPE